MKWILGACLAGVVGWYFANEMLQEHAIFSLNENGKWVDGKKGWGIISTMFPILIILAISSGLFLALFVSYFSSREEELAKSYDDKLKEGLRDAQQQDKDLLTMVTSANTQLSRLRGEIERLNQDNLAKEKKINHQHSTIQRLHKKIGKLKLLEH